MLIGSVGMPAESSGWFTRFHDERWRNHLCSSILMTCPYSCLTTIRQSLTNCARLRAVRAVPHVRAAPVERVHDPRLGERLALSLEEYLHGDPRSASSKLAGRKGVASSFSRPTRIGLSCENVPVPLTARARTSPWWIVLEAREH